MLRKFTLVWLISLILPNLVGAEMRIPVPDVIECLKSVESLDDPYRTSIQFECIGLAGDICVAQDSADIMCLSELSASIRGFYAVLAPLLPPSIEGSDFAVRSYTRGLEQAADTFAIPAECSDLSGNEFAYCEYIELGFTTRNLLRRARQADILLP